MQIDLLHYRVAIHAIWSTIGLLMKILAVTYDNFFPHENLQYIGNYLTFTINGQLHDTG